MSGGPKILKKGALIKQEDPAGEGQSGNSAKGEVELLNRNTCGARQAGK
jgi:hypothetical protein